MPGFDWAKTAESLKPHEFELLLRAYCKRQAWRVRDRLDTEGHLQMSFRVNFDTSGEIEKTSWNVSKNWGDDTSAEVLDGVVNEFCRREGWRNGSEAKLLLIEGES